MNIHEQTTPVALHRLFTRLLDDHQRMYPHHAHLCPLCQDTECTLDLLADELPDGDSECPGCCAPKGEPHADSCPGMDGKCPGCAVQPGQRHLEYCPVGRSTTVFTGLANADRFCSSTGFRCATCCAKAGEPHAHDCREGRAAADAERPLPLGVSYFQGPNGISGFSYPGATATDSTD